MTAAAQAIADLACELLGGSHARVTLSDPTGVVVAGEVGIPTPQQSEGVATPWGRFSLVSSGLSAYATVGLIGHLSVQVAPGRRAEIHVYGKPRARDEGTDQRLAPLRPLLELVARAPFDQAKLRHVDEIQRRQRQHLETQASILRQIAHRVPLAIILQEIITLPAQHGRALPAAVRIASDTLHYHELDASLSAREGHVAPVAPARAAPHLVPLSPEHGVHATALVAPIYGAGGARLGQFELYYPVGVGPLPVDFRIAEAATSLAAVAAEAEAVTSELEVARKAATQVEKLAAIGTLVAGVAHEVNNPLQVVMGNAEIIRLAVADMEAVADPSDDVKVALAEITKRSNSITSSAEHLARITRGLTRTVKPSRSVRAPTDLDAVARSVLEIIGSQAPSGIDVSLELGATRPASACDADVAQILINLLLNAFEALRGRKPAAVVIRTRDLDEDHVGVEVTDDGPGIPAEIEARMFTPFNTSRAEGTGLGLPLSRRLARDNGGELTYLTARGGGTTFTLSLRALEAQP